VTTPPTPSSGGDAREVRELRRFAAGLPWLPLLTACLPLLVVAARALGESGDPLTIAGDYAVLELGARSALHLDQLLGPYSRYLWNHPGPVMFLAVAPFYGVTGTEAGGMGLGAAAWNLAVVAAIVLLAHAAGGRRWAWSAAVTIVLWTYAYGPEQLADPWNPTMTVLPTAGLVVAGAAFAAGQRWALPVLAVLATMAVQTHVGTAVVVVAVGAVALVAGLVFLVRQRGAEGWASLLPPALVTVAALAVLWAPPLWQQLTYEPGNLGELVAFARDDRDQPPRERRESIESATELVVGVHRPVGRVVRETGPSSPLPDLSTPEWALAGLLGLGLAAGIVVGVARRRWFGVAAAGLSLLAWSAAVVAADSAQGDLYLYLLAFVSGVGLAVWLAVAGNVVEVLPRRVVDPVARWVPVAGVVLAALVSFDAARGPLPLRRYSAPELGPVVDAAVAHAEAADARAVRLRIVHDSQWPWAAAVAVELEDRGFDVTVDAPWTFMFGEDRAPTGDEDELLSFTRPDDPPPTPEDSLVVAADPTAVYAADEVHPGPAAIPVIL
jgi:hypothetical protein